MENLIQFEELIVLLEGLCHSEFHDFMNAWSNNLCAFPHEESQI